MTAIRYVKGDATAPAVQGDKVIVQICNDAGKWGRGFVMAVSQRWPIAREVYRLWHAGQTNQAISEHIAFYADHRDGWQAHAVQQSFDLGAVQFVHVQRDIIVCNMIAQHGIGQRSGPPIRYGALEKCLTYVVEYLGGPDRRGKRPSVHMPRIGCGLAGGKWSEVAPLIEKTLCAADIDVTVYDLEPARARRVHEGL